MTEEEILIGTYRYRAPAVVPLEGNRFCVLTYGWPVERTICAAETLAEVLQAYIDWNVLGENRRLARPPKRAAAGPDLEAAELLKSLMD